MSPGRKSLPQTTLTEVWDILFPGNREWIARSACRNLTPEGKYLFIPLTISDGGGAKRRRTTLGVAEIEALSICAGCRTRPECLADFLESPLQDIKRTTVAGLTFVGRRGVHEALLDGTLVEKAPGLLERWGSKIEIRRFVQMVPLLQPRRRSSRNRGKSRPESPK